MRDLIPFIDEPNPQTGVTNAKLGIWLFLASEVMLFAALFASMITLKINSTTWSVDSAGLDAKLATINTFILIASSIAITLAYTALRKRSLGAFKARMGISILLGIVFLAIKGFEYQTKFAHGLLPSTSVFYATYFTLTGVHALHVIGGLIVNAYLLVPGMSLARKHPEEFVGRVECAAIYWHFVDVVWILVFASIYLA